MERYNDDEEYWKHIFSTMEFDSNMIKEYIEDINLEYLFKYQKVDEATLLWLHNS